MCLLRDFLSVLTSSCFSSGSGGSVKEMLILKNSYTVHLKKCFAVI